MSHVKTCDVKRGPYDYDLLSVERDIFEYYQQALSRDSLSHERSVCLKEKLSELKSQENPDGRVLMKYGDLEYLHSCLKQTQMPDVEPVYLYQLMRLTVLELPKPAPREVSPEYESRMQKLRRQAEEAEYQAMTKDVSSKGKPQENIGQELRKIDSQITFMFNFVLTVVGAFAFGYKAVEYTLETPNVSLQLTAGVTLATAVFFADIYFIIKDYV